MFSRSQIWTCAAALALTGSIWAQPPQPQMPPPGGAGQNPPVTGTPMGTPTRDAAGNPGTTPQMQNDPYMEDKDFVRSLAETSATQEHLGKIAQEKGSTDAVKEFAKQTVEKNTETGKQLQQAATALNVPISSDPPKKAKKAEDKLSKLSGAEFDKAYAKMAADEQKQEVKQFERESKNGKVPGLKDFASKNLAGEQERQKQAEELASGGNSTTASRK